MVLRAAQWGVRPRGSQDRRVSSLIRYRWDPGVFRGLVRSRVRSMWVESGRWTRFASAVIAALTLTFQSNIVLTLNSFLFAVAMLCVSF